MAMMKRLVCIFGFYSLVLTHQLSIAESVENKTDGVRFNLKLAMIDQTGSVIKSGSFTANFENWLDPETLSLMEFEDSMVSLVLAPELTFYGSAVELESEEKTTTETTLTILSLRRDGKEFQAFINFKIGLQDIDTTTNAGEESSENNEVVIWNPGIKVPVNGNVDFSWEYQLSQKKIFSDKTQHKNSFSIVFHF
jgi:hypothetical protein